MDYNKKYLKYKNKYLALQGGQAEWSKTCQPEEISKIKNEIQNNKTQNSNQLNLENCEITKETRTLGMRTGILAQQYNRRQLRRISKIFTDRCAQQRDKKNKNPNDMLTFAKEFKIDLSKAEKCQDIFSNKNMTQEQKDKSCIDKFESQDDFFVRKLYPAPTLHDKIAKEKDKYIVSPAECYTLLFNSENESRELWIKEKKYTVQNVLGNPQNNPMNMSNGVSILIFRLAPGQYHRYHSPLDGEIIAIGLFGSDYWSVQPAIVHKRDVFTENKRVVLFIRTKYFGIVSLVIVGASCIGSIEFNDQYSKLNNVLKQIPENNYAPVDNIKMNIGDDLGSFHYGGSTILLFIPNQPNIEYHPTLLQASQNYSIETEIKVLQPLAYYNDSNYQNETVKYY